MTTSIRPCFARPVEHISATTDVTFGAGAAAVPSGVYANIIALFRAFRASNTTWVSSIRMSDALKFEFQAGQTGTITWNNTTLRDALGFAGASVSVTSGNWYTATYTPQYLWYSEHYFADQGSFRTNRNTRFAGEKSLTGNLSGIATGATFKSRTMRFNAEMGNRLGEELCENQQEKERCLDLFFDGSICATPAVSTHPSPRGFWYYQNVNEFIADCTVSGSEWATSGGTDFSFSSSPSTYCFCNFDEDGISDWMNEPFFQVGRLRYGVELSFTTAILPGVFL